MPTRHTVQQGENLSAIARKYKIPRWQDIYDDADNEDLRSLRPDPNLLYPGDVVVIPDIEPQHAMVATDQKHRFVVRRNSQTLKIRLLNTNEEPLSDEVRVEAELAGEIRPLERDGDSVVELRLMSTDPSELLLHLYKSQEATVPWRTYTVELSRLDPSDTISGVQARLNALGYSVGAVDGIVGDQTRRGVEAFQTAKELTVDGEPGPQTQSALTDAYGC